MKKSIKKFAAGLYFSLVFLSVLVFLQIVYYSYSLPDNFYRSDRSEFSVSAFFPITAKNTVGTDIAASADKNGKDKMQLMLYGVIPIKAVTVQQKEAPMLTPLGQPFGLKILTEGAIVTDFGMVDGTSGKDSPAEKSGIKTGDIIISVNGVKINSAKELLDALQKRPECALLTVIRQGKEITLEAVPEKSRQDGLYKLGMWTKDSCAGIGTLTYYNSADGSYGGLGHSVCDSDTGQLLPLASGEVVPVCISRVIKGCSGSPGELCGSFLSDRKMGNILLNSQCGIFGTLERSPSEKEPIPMAFKQEAQIGEAVIYTTLNGTEPEEYDILIEKINFNADSDVKNMVIRITDSRLLAEAGGIAQGMSGSPIIQNGKLVGAVTHVFVNEINRGYAIFAENMYRAAAELNQMGGELARAS